MVDRASDYGNKTPQFLNSDSFLDLATGGKAEDRVSKGNAPGGSLKISVIFFFHCVHTTAVEAGWQLLSRRTLPLSTVFLLTLSSLKMNVDFPGLRQEGQGIEYIQENSSGTHCDISLLALCEMAREAARPVSWCLL